MNEQCERITTKEITYIGIFAALMAICAWISIPMTVPFTMQTFAIFFAVALLGTKRATLSVIVYILLGAIGLPVFAGFRGGIGVLFDRTGGYLVGFVLSSLISGFLIQRLGRNTFTMFGCMVIGLVICYLFGTVWFMHLYTQAKGSVALMTVLGWCVIPYVIPDLVKIALAIILAKRIGPVIK